MPNIFLLPLYLLFVKMKYFNTLRYFKIEHGIIHFLLKPNVVKLDSCLISV